jgi:protein TonB
VAVPEHPAGFTDGADLGNVIPFVRLKRDGDQPTKAPEVGLGPADHRVPAPGAAGSRAQIIALIAASALLHGGLLVAALDRDPPPMASIGLEAISVEIVVGAASPVEPETPTEAKTSTAAPTAPDPQPPEATEQREAAVQPRDMPPEPEKPPVEITPPEPVALAPPPAQGAPKPPERAAEPQTQPEPVPAPKPPKPPVREATPPRPHRPPATDARPPTRHAALAPAPSTPGSASPGRSDADTNYRGVAAAHLAKFKQFPADARSRGEQGSGVVSFTIDAGGRVTRVALVRGTGIASLDQESQAMVRRASPFPPPPGGHAISITAPVNFHLR